MTSATDRSQRPASTRAWLWTGLAPALVLALGSCAMLAIIFSMQTEMIARDRDNQMAAVSEAITAALDQAGKFALAQAETTARRQSVGRALAAGNRADLQDLSAATYAYLKTQSVPVFGFHSADMRYLLRLHLPDSFGDDLSKIRPMVLAANRTRRAQVGLEIGIAGTFVRGVAVVENGGEFAGTVEAGLNLQPILEQVKLVTNADIAIVLSQSLAGLPARGPNDKGPGEVFGDLNLFASTDSQFFASLLRDGAIRLARSREVVGRTLQGESGAVLVQPLIDFSGRMIGNVVAAKTSAYQGAELRRTRIDLIATAMIGTILAFVAFSILARVIASRAGARG